MLQVLVIVLPVALGALEALAAERVGGTAAPTTVGSFLRDVLVLGSVAFGTLVLLQLVLATVLPRLLRRMITPGRTYALFGFRYSLLRLVTRLSNRPFLDALFGDSSAITRYLRLLGYDLGRVQQTGSNFGTTQKHDTPFAVSVGRGTMISDGLSLANAEYTSSGFRVREAHVGERNFLGNNVIVPAEARIGDNVLLATKVLVPVDGEVREDTGLLGSPAFPIPRSVERDGRFDHLAEGEEFRRRLRRKNVSNTLTGFSLLAARWAYALLLTAAGLGDALLHGTPRATRGRAGRVGRRRRGRVWFTLVERAAMGFRRLSPRYCSIYDPYFWRHERLWKLLPPFLALFDGTPMKALVLRALGVRVGKRLFDDGAAIPEHTLVTLGDDVTLDVGSTIQCHSLEDGTFKSDRTEIGDGVSLGVAAFVHYGVETGANSVLDADGFLMKGSVTSPDSRWRGNPAEPA
ncbi:hypothetical protein [Pseudonocardia sp. NPDC049154]|uniref:hypothetical protein n=1 Tax=Pseudonocardia sp. NPDC049154 TaxID=3155501 RepID=UPI0033E5CBBC